MSHMSQNQARETYTLTRDGQRPLRFTGTLLAENHGARTHGRDNTRYYTLAVYRTDAQRILIHWEYTSQWQGELSHSAMTTTRRLPEAVTALEAFDPTMWVVAYRPIIQRHGADSPSAKHYLPRQAQVEADISARYHAQVAALAAKLGVVDDLAAEDEEAIPDVYRPTAALWDLLRCYAPAEAAHRICVEADTPGEEAALTRVLSALAERARGQK